MYVPLATILCSFFVKSNVATFEEGVTCSVEIPTPVKFEPSPSNEVAVKIPVTIAPVFVVMNFKLLLQKLRDRT